MKRRTLAGLGGSQKEDAKRKDTGGKGKGMGRKML